MIAELDNKTRVNLSLLHKIIQHIAFMLRLVLVKHPYSQAIMGAASEFRFAIWNKNKETKES